MTPSQKCSKCKGTDEVKVAGKRSDVEDTGDRRNRQHATPSVGHSDQN
jgi:hypothetical protein